MRVRPIFGSLLSENSARIAQAFERGWRRLGLLGLRWGRRHTDGLGYIGCVIPNAALLLPSFKGLKFANEGKGRISHFCDTGFGFGGRDKSALGFVSRVNGMEWSWMILLYDLAMFRPSHRLPPPAMRTLNGPRISPGF